VQYRSLWNPIIKVSFYQRHRNAKYKHASKNVILLL
jgi:hypothetical protein